jgi:hypothetical protein
MFEVRWETLTTIETVADLDEQSFAHSFAQVVGMNAEGYKSFARTTARLSTSETSRLMESRVLGNRSLLKTPSLLSNRLRITVP